MATDAAITAALTAATTLNISAAQMVALLKRAIAAPIVDATSGRYIVGMGADGSNISYGSIADMVAALKYFQELSVTEAGGLASAQVEFQA